MKDWVGLFNAHRNQARKVIALRQLTRMHYQRLYGSGSENKVGNGSGNNNNNSRFRKFTCQFYAPKHAGSYAFRYFRNNDDISTLDSNEVIVTIRGSDLDDAFSFVDQKVEDITLLGFHISSLTSTIQYTVDLNGWKRPEMLEHILHVMIEPLMKEQAPKEYSQVMMNNLHYLVKMIIRTPKLLSHLSSACNEEIAHLMSHYCNICSLFVLQDELLEKHMLGDHTIAPITSFAFFSQAFMNELTRQAVLASKELLPTDAFYQTRSARKLRMTCRERLIARLIDGFHRHDRFRQSLIYIYGSSNNGFGTEGSDVDLCFVDPSITYDMIPQITDSIISILKEMQLQEIDDSRLHARIPVIRFMDPTSQLQCDLCFNNILPIRNTLLLKTYSSIDPRVRVLGLILKKWFFSNTFFI